MTDEYDFSDLTERFKAAQEAAIPLSGDDNPNQVATALFLGSLIEELEEAVSDLQFEVPKPRRKKLDDYGDYRHEDYEEDEEPPPPILKGRNPISLLNELCQARGIGTPEFNIQRMGGEDHIPQFEGSVKVDEFEVKVTNSKSKADARKALSKKMLLEHFDAKENY